MINSLVNEKFWFLKKFILIFGLFLYKFNFKLYFFKLLKCFF